MAEYMKQFLGNIKGPQGDKGETGSHLISCATYARTYTTEELDALTDTTFDKVTLKEKANAKDFITIPIVVSDRGDSGGYLLFQLKGAALPGIEVSVAGTALAYAHGGKGDAAGFGQVTATVDEIPLAIPTVEVQQSGPHSARDINFDFKGLKGDAAGFGEITATMDDIPSHHPTVTASWEGPNEAKNLTFDFKGIKGQPAGFGEITATADDTHLDEPIVNVTTSGTNEEMDIKFEFQGLMGYTGPTGAQIIASTCESREMTTTQLDEEITEWTGVTTKAREGDFVCLPVVVTDKNGATGYVLFQVSVNDQDQQKITGEKFAYTYGGKGDAAGFGTVTATADGQHLDEPTVEVRQSGPHTARDFEFDFKGLTGKPAGFGEITTKVEENFPGTPSIEASMDGPETAKNIEFTFKQMKGERGGLSYKPLSEARFTKLSDAGKEAGDFEYIYYLDGGFSADPEDSILASAKNALLILFSMGGLGQNNNGIVQLLWIDNSTAPSADYAGNAALYLRSFPVARMGTGAPMGVFERTSWLQVFPLRKITNEDIDEMIKGTYVSPFDDPDAIALVESREFNYFVQAIQNV